MADPKIRYDIEAAVSGDVDVNRLTKELEQLDGSLSPALAEQAQLTVQRLRELGAEKAAIDRFGELKAASEAAGTKLQEAQQQAQDFARSLASTAAPTRAQTGQLEKLRDAVNAADKELERQTAALDDSRAALTRAGIPIEGLSKKQADLRKEIASSIDEFKRLGSQAEGTNVFSKLAGQTEDARIALVKSEAAFIEFKASLVGVAQPTQTQQLRLEALTGAVKANETALQKATDAQAEAASRMRGAGVDVDRLATAQARVRSETLLAAEASRTAAIAAAQQGRAFTVSATEQTAAAKNLRGEIGGIGSQLRTLQTIAGSVIGGQLLGGAAGDVLKTADAFENLRARIKLATGDGRAFDESFQGVFDVAKRTNSALESTGNLFTRIATAGKEMGLSNQQALALTETINQAVQLSGASAEASDAAITQLIQGLQSGVLRGEEFNSVMEQSPRLAKALADGLGVPIGKLREMAQQGQLTTQTVVQALRDQRAVVEKEFGSLPVTVGRAITNLQTEWAKFVGQTSESTGATAVVADGINALAANLQGVADAAARAGAVLTGAVAVAGVAALRAFVAEGGLAAATAATLSASLGSIPKVISITVAVAGFEVGFQIGEMLRENSALARQLGVGIVGFFEAIISDLQLLSDAASAIFSSDTVSAAFDRFNQRSIALQDNLQAMWQDAEKSPQQVAAETAKATQAVQQLGTTSTTAGGAITTAGTAGAAAVGGIATKADAARDSIVALAKLAGVSLPAIGTSARDAADGLLQVVLKGGQANGVFATELPAALSKLSGTDLANFAAAVDGTLSQAITTSRRLATELQATGQDGSKALSDADRAAALLQQTMAAVGVQAAKSLGVDVAPLTKNLSEGFVKSAADLEVLVQRLPALQRAGVDTGAVVAQALGSMINRAQNEAELDAIAQRIGALGQGGVIAGDQIKGALQAASDKAIDLRAKVEEATPGMQSLGEAARKAGVDVDLLKSGVSKGFADGVANISNLAQQIAATGVSAEKAGPVLAGMLNQQVAAAKTTEEAKAIQREIEQIVAKSPGLSAALGGALDAAREKAAALTPEMQRVQAAASRLGVTLGTDIPRGANSAIQAYETLKASGKGTADAVAQGFIAMAREVIAAADGQVSDWLKVEAAMRGVTIQTDEMGNALAIVADTGQQAGQAIGAAFRQAGNEIQQTINLSDRLRQSGPPSQAPGGSGSAGGGGGDNQTTAPSGLLSDPANRDARNARFDKEVAAAREKRLSGQNAIDAGGFFIIQEKLRAGTLTAEDAPLVEALKASVKQNSIASQGAPGSAFSLEFLQSLAAQSSVAQSADMVVRELVARQNNPELANQRRGGGGGGGATYKVELSLNGQSSTTIQTADEAAARALADWVRGLNDAAARAIPRRY